MRPPACRKNRTKGGGPLEGHQPIAPGPGALRKTSHSGRRNVMTMSWHMTVKVPPAPRRPHRPGRGFQRRRAPRREGMRDRRSERGAREKGVKNRQPLRPRHRQVQGLAPLPAGHVSALLIAECLASLECRVVGTRMANMHNLFVPEVAPQTVHHRGYARFLGRWPGNPPGIADVLTRIFHLFRDLTRIKAA